MPKEIEELIGEINTKFDQLKKDGASKAELNTITSALDELKSLSTSKMEELDKVLKEHGLLIDGIKVDEDKKATVSEQKQINDFIEANIDEIKSSIKKGTYVEFEVKAPATIATTSGTMQTNPSALGPLTNVNLRKADLMQYVDISETSRGQFSYSEATPKEGDALNVAEGTAKPQIDLEWKENWVKPTKVAAWLKLTEEAQEDVIGLKAVARDFLRKKHDIRVENDVYFGDGIAPNSEGATTIARTFNVGSMAGDVVNPTLIDVINACIVDIASTPNYVDEAPYIANVAFVNPVDFFLNFAAAKDANGLPMYPNASLFNELKIGPTTIVPTFRIPTGKVFVADMDKYHVVKRKSYIVKIGFVNDDFIKNLNVILGESRYFAYVQTLDRAAFIYDDIHTIVLAIQKTAPAA